MLIFKKVKYGTSNIIDMKYLFHQCSSLESIPDISCGYIENL